MASSVNESMVFLCDKVMLDGQRLMPLDPEVNFVFLRINVNTQEMQFIYKDSLDNTAEERELILKWEHVTGTSISKQYSDNLVTFKFNNNLCGYSVCHLFVSNLVFNRLCAVIDIMYFNIMRNRYGLTEEQARANIRDVYVMEDDNFGLEEDQLASGNNNSSDKNNENFAQSLISLDDLDTSSQTVSSISTNDGENLSQSSAHESEPQGVVDENIEMNESDVEIESIAQLAIDERSLQIVPVDENETDGDVAIEGMNEDVELLNDSDDIVQLAAQENAETEMVSLIIDEEDVEEK